MITDWFVEFIDYNLLIKFSRQDARAGLAIFSNSEALGLEGFSALEFIKQLTSIAR